MISSFDFDWYTSRCWLEVLERGDITSTDMFEFLCGDTADARGFDTVHVPQSAHEAVAAIWHATHGEKTIPVQIEAQLNEAEHIGMTGRIAPGPICTFFAGYKLLSLTLLKQTSTAQVLREYHSDDLSELELGRLASAITVIEPQLEPLGVDSIHHRLHVAEFSNPDVLGLHINSDGRTGIYIGRSVLADSLSRTIQVLVHEIAHDRGGDGSASHEQAEGALFSAIIADLATSQERLPFTEARQQLAGVAA